MAKTVTDCAADDSHTLYEPSDENSVLSEFAPVMEEDSLEVFESDASGRNEDEGNDEDLVTTMLSRNNADSNGKMPRTFSPLSCNTNEPLNLSMEPISKKRQNEEHNNLCFVTDFAEFSPGYLKEEKRSDDDIYDPPIYGRNRIPNICEDTDGNGSRDLADTCWDNDHLIYSNGEVIPGKQRISASVQCYIF